MPRLCLLVVVLLSACESTRSYGPVLVCAFTLQQSTEQRELSTTQRDRYGWDTLTSIDLVFQDGAPQPDHHEQDEHDQVRAARAWVPAHCVSRALCELERRAKRHAFARLGLNGGER